MGREATCIYIAESPVCIGHFDPAIGEGDHVIPSALGEFEGDERFRGACNMCNNLFGQYEQQIAQSSLSGYLRYHARARSKRINRRGLKPMKGAKGAPAPEHFAVVNGQTIAVRPSIDKPEDAYPFDQLRVTDNSGQEFVIELHPEMSTKHIRSRFEKLEIGKVKQVFVHCDEKHWDRYIAIVQEACGQSTVTELGSMESGTQRVQGRAKFTVNTAYFQAIAKLAFHYYLVHGSRGYLGNEPTFQDLRQFICNGGDIDKFFDKTDRIIIPLGPEHGGASPANWCHLLVADEGGPNLLSRVQLFLGPGSVPHAHSVLLGHIAENNLGMVFGHVFEFDGSEGGGRYSGSVKPVPPEAFSLLRPPSSARKNPGPRKV